MADGIIYGMNLRMDKSGRIVLPKPLRKRLGLEPEAELEVVEHPDGVLLRTVTEQPSMVRVDGLWVHRGMAEPDTNWERLMNDIREERIQSVLKS